MSASERLRELDAAIMHGYLRDGGGPLATLSLALPQIVALVGVAESVLSDLDRGRSAATPQIGRDIRAALCALDDALTAGGSE
jgi:hypothetical protein